MAAKKIVSTDEQQENPPVAKKKLPAKKKPSLSKKQRSLIKLLNAGGYAQMMKTMDDKVRFKVCDATKAPIEYVHTKTINSLVKNNLIYKATDGKFYSEKLKAEDESKPGRATNDGIKQAELQLETPSDSNDSVKRTNKAGSRSVSKRPAKAADRSRSAGNKTGKR